MKLLFLSALLVSFSAANVWAAPPIQHIFIIVLENKGFDQTFGPSSPAPYLSQTLTSQGQLLRHYYGIGHASLDNYLANRERLATKRIVTRRRQSGW
jgi:hypothetical protein